MPADSQALQNAANDIKKLAANHGFLDVQVSLPNFSSRIDPEPTLADEEATYVKDAGAAGNGLFAKRDIRPGELVMRVERPMGYVLDSPQLARVCEWCLIGGDEGMVESVQLKKCGGCGVVRFCGEPCQKSSWRHHKLECNLFKCLYPNLLPNTVRMAVQFLLRRKHKLLLDPEWSSFTNLQHHTEGFKTQYAAEGAGAWENVQLMAKAAREYSKSQEDLRLVESLIGRILINTHTLTNSTCTPLGLALTPRLALLNHSCSPNSTLSFSGPMLSLHSLLPIAATSEITISYIDATDPPPTRQRELQKRYFFTCTCLLCVAPTPCTLFPTNPDPPPALTNALPPPILATLDATADAAIARSNRDPLARIPALRAALAKFAPHAQKGLYPLHRQPYARLRAELVLALLTAGHWVEAFAHTLVTRFLIDPVHFPATFHPVRAAHAYVLLKLTAQLAHLAHEGDAEVLALLHHVPLNLGVVAFGLLRELSDNVAKSHGAESRFARMVAVERELFRRNAGGKLEVGEEDVGRMEGVLRSLVDEVVFRVEG